MMIDWSGAWILTCIPTPFIDSFEYEPSALCFSVLYFPVTAKAQGTYHTRNLLVSLAVRSSTHLYRQFFGLARVGMGRALLERARELF